jgi:hypothetical protein
MPDRSQVEIESLVLQGAGLGVELTNPNHGYETLEEAKIQKGLYCQ